MNRLTFKGLKKNSVVVGIVLIVIVPLYAQNGPLTYPQLLTALNAKLPSGVTRTKVINKLITDVRSRKVDKPLTADLEDILRQAGSTDELIAAIRTNSPQNSSGADPEDVVPKSDPSSVSADTLVRWRATVRRRQGATLLNLLTMILSRDEGNTPALWMRSMAYAQTRQFDKAEQDARAILSLLRSPKSSDDYAALCVAKINLKLFVDSEADCSKTLTLDPNYPEARVGLGISYLVGNQLDQASGEFTKAIGFDSQYVTAYFNRGRAYQSKQQMDLAVGDYSKAIELDQGFADAYLNRGSIYGQSKQFDRAIADFTSVINLDARNVGAYLGRAISYLSTQQLALAESDYTKVLQIDPANMLAFLGRGFAHDMKGESDLAIADYSKAIQLQPRSKEAYFNRGLAYFHQKQYALAVADYSKAIEIDPAYGAAFRGRSQAYDAKGDKRSADADRQRADQLEGVPKLSR